MTEMLEMADVSARDSIYDLGSGDGRIVITAARRYGAAGLGVELDSTLVAEARQRAEREGVGDRARIVAHDFDMDGWQADSVTRTPGGLGGEATLYLWIVPARVGGTWALSLPGGDKLRVRIDQRFQELRARVPGAGDRRVTAAGPWSGRLVAESDSSFTAWQGESAGQLR